MDIQIRKVKNDWKEMPNGITYYFIGQPKTGKTTAASKWSSKGSEGVLLIDTDLGSDFVENANTITVSSLNEPIREKMSEDGRKIVNKKGQREVEIVPPEERGFYYRSGDNKGKPMPVYSMSEVLQWIKSNWNKVPYDTIVIDTIDQVNRWIEEKVTRELNIRAMGEGQWGADWGMARRNNVDIIVRFQKLMKQLGGNLVLISHSKTTTITDGKAQLSPELPRGLAYSITAKADVIGYSTVDKESGDYKISFESYDERTVGSRLKPLAQKSLLFDYKTILNEILTYKEK
tara:strand:+ start:3787 stop:4653 length:867 start_codon:yes stop_codon:yes gene_type:complete